MRIFLDSCVIIECFTRSAGDDVTTLRHLYNLDVEIITSITVLGECLDQCHKKDLDPLALLDLIKSLDIGVTYPSVDLRQLCIDVDEHLENIGRYGSSCTDRTHFAYAIEYECDFFITSIGETRTLDCPPLRIGRIRPIPATLKEIRAGVIRKTRGEIISCRPVPLLLSKDKIPCDSSTG